MISARGSVYKEKTIEEIGKFDSALEENKVRVLKENRLKVKYQKNLWLIIFTLPLIWGSLRLYTGEAKWIFMNNVNLIFHEAGHVLFMFFGSFLYALGGTLAEIIIPTIIIVYFLIKRNIYAVSLGL